MEEVQRVVHGLGVSVFNSPPNEFIHNLYDLNILGTNFIESTLLKGSAFIIKSPTNETCLQNSKCSKVAGNLYCIKKMTYFHKSV